MCRQRCLRWTVGTKCACSIQPHKVETEHLERWSQVPTRLMVLIYTSAVQPTSLPAQKPFVQLLIMYVVCAVVNY